VLGVDEKMRRSTADAWKEIIKALHSSWEKKRHGPAGG